MTTNQTDERPVQDVADHCRQLRNDFESALGLPLEISCQDGAWWRGSDDSSAGLKLVYEESVAIADWLSGLATTVGGTGNRHPAAEVVAGRDSVVGKRGQA